MFGDGCTAVQKVFNLDEPVIPEENEFKKIQFKFLGSSIHVQEAKVSICEKKRKSKQWKKE
jgi:hypothetical protein